MVLACRTAGKSLRRTEYVQAILWLIQYGNPGLWQRTPQKVGGAIFLLRTLKLEDMSVLEPAEIEAVRRPEFAIDADNRA